MHRIHRFRPRPDSIIDNCICIKGKKDSFFPFCFCEKEKGYQCEFCEENLNTDCNCLECKCYCHSASSKCICEHYCSPECLCNCHGNIKISSSLTESESQSKTESKTESQSIKVVKNYFSEEDHQKLIKSIDLSNYIDENSGSHSRNYLHIDNHDNTLSIDYIDEYFDKLSQKIEKSCECSSSSSYLKDFPCENCHKDKDKDKDTDTDTYIGNLCKCNIECPVGCLCSFLCKAERNCINSCLINCECKCHIEMNLLCTCSDLCNEKCMCTCHNLILECKKKCYCGCHFKCANDD